MQLVLVWLLATVDPAQEIDRLKTEREINTQVQLEIDRYWHRSGIIVNFFFLVLLLASSLSNVLLWWFYRRSLDKFSQKLQAQSQLIGELLRSPPDLQRLPEPTTVPALEEAIAELTAILPPLAQDKIYPEHRGQLAKALDKLESSINDSGAELSTQARVQYAHALYFLERYPAAIATYEKILHQEPELVVAWQQKAHALLKLADYPGAIAAYNQVINLQADNAQAWYKLAYCYTATGEVSLAISHLQRAINLNPICRTRARNSPDFAQLRRDERFNQMID